MIQRYLKSRGKIQGRALSSSDGSVDTAAQGFKLSSQNCRDEMDE